MDESTVANGREYGLLRDSIKEHIRLEREARIEGRPVAADGKRLLELMDRSETFLTRSGINYIGYVKAYYTTMTVGGLLAALIGCWLLGRSLRQRFELNNRNARSYIGIAFGGWAAIVGTYCFLTHAADCVHVWVSPTTLVMGRAAEFIVPLIKNFL